MAARTTIDIDLDKACARCGKPGALPNGLCLECHSTDGLNRIRKGAAMTDQMSLAVEYVELDIEERIERGQMLAAAWRRLRLVLAEHKDRRAEMKEERETIEAEITALAEVVRTAREERPIAVEDR